MKVASQLDLTLRMRRYRQTFFKKALRAEAVTDFHYELIRDRFRPSAIEEITVVLLPQWTRYVGGPHINNEKV